MAADRVFRAFSGVVILFSIFFLCYYTVNCAAEDGFQEKFNVGDTAPDFTAMDIHGKEVTLSKFKGSKIVVLNFWGIRCGACIEEMPYLEDMHQRYSSKDTVFLGVDTDGVDGETVKSALDDLGIKISYQLLTDVDFTITDVYTNFLVPLTLVIDKQGVIQYIHTGFEKGREKEYEGAVLNILKTAS